MKSSERPEISPPGGTNWGPLHYVSFRRTMVARIVSGAGSWMQTVAAGWLVFQITDSATAVGILTVASRGPGIVLTGFGGQLADRYDGRRLIIGLAGIQTVVAAILAVVSWNYSDQGSVLFIYLSVLLIGSAGALGTAAQQTIVVASVPREVAKQATGYASVAFNIARLVGPALGGVLVALIGAGSCFALNALSYLVVVFAIWDLDLPDRNPSQPTRIVEAVQKVRGDRFVLDLVIGATLFSLIVAPIQELAPTIADANGNGAHLLGFLLAAMALGGIIGNRARVSLEARGVGTTLLISGALFVGALALGLLGLTSLVGIDAFGQPYAYGLTLFASFLGGVAWDTVYVVGLTGVQLRERSGEGLIVGLFFTLTVGGLTLGALAMGFLFDHIGLGATLLAGGGLMALIATQYRRMGVDATDADPSADGRSLRRAIR